MTTFDPRGILTALERHRVNYVVIGGFARVVQGTDELTRDVDICPAVRGENLTRLASALADLDATGLPRSLHADEPHIDDVVELDTRCGHLTVVREPAGTRGYDDLRRGADREPLGGGLRAPIAGADDLARMLDTLDRPGDPQIVATLRTVIELDRSLGLEL